MDAQKIFEILEIPETKDEDAIKAAYRSKLVSVNPEDNPEGFKQLREAYEAGLRYAAKGEENTPGDKPDDPVSLYLDRLDSVYRSLPRRLESSEWESLLKDDLLDDLDLCEDAKWGLFRYLADHYELPTAVWRMLDQVFHVEKEQSKFKEHLPVNFVDFIVWSCSEEAELCQFPYEQLMGSDTADHDEFIHQLQSLARLSGQEHEYADRSLWLKELEQKIAFLETFHISHPRFELEKAKYVLAEGQNENALNRAGILLESETSDSRILLGCARIYKCCGQDEKAERIYRNFLEPENASEKEQDPPKHGDNDIYTASMGLADILFRREEYKKAVPLILTAQKIYNTPEAETLLTDCSNRIIEQTTQSQAPDADLAGEEALKLADCYIWADRAAEGMKYFLKHPHLLTEDTINCHRTKAVLFLAGGRYTDALAETLAWYKKLSDDPNTENPEYAQSYIYKAKVHEEIYKSFSDKQSQEASEHRDAAFCAYAEAIRLVPGDVNVLRSKIIFLRTLWESESSEDYYRQAAELSEEMKKLDANYFWAYYYAQEAYEKLGKAQLVIDNFYEAKKIYAGLPEIYERAAKVFRYYEQYNDMGNILKQAEEAGVESDRLKVLKMEFLQETVTEEEQVLEADSYNKDTIAALEETLSRAEQNSSMSKKELSDLKRLLAEAYRQHVLLHDNHDKPEGFKNTDDIERLARRSLELADMFSNRYFLGYFYLYEKKDYTEAFKHLKACERMGTSHWVYRRLALCLEDWEQWDAAIEYFKKGAALVPDNDSYLWRIGWLYRTKFSRTGQREYYEMALKYLDRQMELFGDNPKEHWNIWWQYSFLHTRNREYEKALEEITRELEVDGRSRNWGHKGYLLELLGRFEEAVSMYEKGIEISWEEQKDYSYGFSQMYDYFCRHRSHKEGLAWFEKMQGNLQTDEQRKENLGYMKNFELRLGHWQKALKLLEEIYGGISLTDYVCDSWEQEGQLIDDLLDAYQYWHSDEQLRKDAQNAASLLIHRAGRKLAEDHEGKRRAYTQIAFCYSNYLLDDRTGLFYFKKALEQAELAGDDTDADDYRNLLSYIMGCLWRLGRSNEAVKYRALYMKSIAKKYEECAGLDKSVEELYLASHSGRQGCYSLFELDLYCGEYEKAAKRLQKLEQSPWCWQCRANDCTEAWECKGYLALIHGQEEEAEKCFERADACALIRNDDARRELRRLRRKNSK